MTTDIQEVLVVPRDTVSDLKGFVAWDDIPDDTISTIRESRGWSPRPHAERSSDLVQLISCAVVRNHEGGISVSRRIAAERKDLNWKYTLVYGGHVEQLEDDLELVDLLKENMLRELQEEIGVDEVDEVEILGTVNDLTDMVSSRHVAVVFDVSVSCDTSVVAEEEFALRSKYHGDFIDPAEIGPLEDRLDPWSKLLFQHWISPEASGDAGMQLGFIVDT